jgi:hypothetical protein
MLHSLLFFYLGQFEVVIWINRENVKIVFHHLNFYFLISYYSNSFLTRLNYLNQNTTLNPLFISNYPFRILLLS